MPEEKETITFELIRNVQLAEQTSQKLVKLPENFFQNVKYYLQQKRKIVETKEDKKAVAEIKSIEHMIEDIFNRRERKILNQILISTRTSFKPENLTQEESEFFEKALDIVKKRREDFFTKMLSKEVEKISLVYFKEDFPSFIGIDLKKYGPFKKGDIVKLPKENMELLIKKGIVEEFKVVR
jgi:DNA replication factor GINS